MPLLRLYHPRSLLGSSVHLIVFQGLTNTVPKLDWPKINALKHAEISIEVNHVACIAELIVKCLQNNL
jgi:hypothetical protein